MTEKQVQYSTAQHSKAYWETQLARIKVMYEALELQKSRNEVSRRIGEPGEIGIPDYLDKGIESALKELAKE